MTLKEVGEAAAVYAPALALLAAILRFTVLQAMKRHRAILREERSSPEAKAEMRQIVKEELLPMQTQATGIETKVDKAIERLELLNGSVERVTAKAEAVDKRTAALENIEKGKEIARAELAAAAQIVKEKTE